MIHKNVKKVGDSAFQSCDNLESIEFCNGVEKIGKQAFRFCECLTDIIIPNTVKVIEKEAFNGCEELKNVKLSENISVIKYGTFRSCKSLESIDIPDGVDSIGDSAFSGCRKLKKVKIPSSVTDIRYMAFYDCKKLTIYASSGSYAQRYAMKEGIPFVATDYSDAESHISNNLDSVSREKANTSENPLIANMAFQHISQSLIYIKINPINRPPMKPDICSQAVALPINIPLTV